MWFFKNIYNNIIKVILIYRVLLTCRIFLYEKMQQILILTYI